MKFQLLMCAIFAYLTLINSSPIGLKSELSSPDLYSGSIDSLSEGEERFNDERAQLHRGPFARVKREEDFGSDNGSSDSNSGGKLLDKLGGFLKKFLGDNGVSIDGVQKILSEIWEAVQKVMGLVKEVGI